MKKTVKLFILFCFSAIIMPACAKTDTPPQPTCRVVTQVDVICRRKQMLLRRHYTDSKKMESVLLYLRLLDPRDTEGSEPDLSGDDIYQITVSLSDGQKRVYRQKSHRYFSADFSPWKAIDPGKACQLYTLLRQLHDDPDFPATPSDSAAVISCRKLFDKSHPSSQYPLCVKCGNFSKSSTNTCFFLYFLYNDIDKIV